MRTSFPQEAIPQRRRAISRQQRLAIFSAVALAPFCMVAALRILAPTAFDFPVILALNSFAHRSQLADEALQGIAAFDLFQGLPIVALAYGAFAASSRDRERVRLVIGVFAAAAAAEVSRLMQDRLPNLPRPIVDPSLPFQRPFGGHPESWRDWSSFPSDHATLLWGVAFATLMINRRIGAASLALAFISALARVYCGLHYVTDVIAGALLAIAMQYAFLAAVAPWEARIASLAKARPALVAAVAFFCGAQVATLFADVREVAHLSVQHVKAIRAAHHQTGPGDAAPS